MFERATRLRRFSGYWPKCGSGPAERFRWRPTSLHSGCPGFVSASPEDETPGLVPYARAAQA